MTRFVSGATTVQFNRDPVRPGGLQAQARQLREFDSSGASRVYTKGATKLITHRLLFSGHNAIDGATLAALRSFLQTTVLGVRKTFTWVDQLDVSRSVRFVSPKLASREIGPDRHAIEILLEEDI